MSLPAHYATTKCRNCGRKIIFVTAVNAAGQQMTIPLDPSEPIYVRQRNGDGGAVWAQDTSRELLVSHFATCSKANDFSGRHRH